MFLKTIQEFFQFMAKPSHDRLEVTFIDKLKRFLVLYLLGFIIIIAVMMLQEKLAHLLGADNLEHALMQSISWQMLLLLAVIAAPILEELIFRFFLKYDRNFLFRFISHIFPIRLQGFWKKSIGFWVYLSAILFGVVHYMNFSGEVDYLIPAVILLTLPQIILGFILAFVRLKMGFFWGISFHAVWNGILTGLMVLFLHNGIISSNQTEAYSIEMEKHFFLQKEKKQVSVTKNDVVDITRIEASNQSLKSLFKEVFETEEQIDDSDYWNTINLTFESTDGISPEELEGILTEEIEKKTNAFY